MKELQNSRSILRIIEAIARLLLTFIMVQPFLFLGLVICGLFLAVPADYFATFGIPSGEVPEEIEYLQEISKEMQDIRERTYHVLFGNIKDTHGLLHLVVFFIMELFFLASLAIADWIYQEFLKPWVIETLKSEWDSIWESSKEDLHSEEKNLPQKPKNEQKTHFYHRIKNFCSKIKKT